ncbi:hypothetical protein EYF80_010874 [Liparis tanakae]|uniref:Uncharacterized protein n=1 Tax=Liparis tanakae TaxID=230148 RepID=A0A4Z2IMJ3_9TELE|nr:hypothetical protein EYF80_010874 [Liparis tanakae]
MAPDTADLSVLFSFDGSAEPATLIEVFWLVVRETMAEGLCVDVRLIVEIHSVRLHNLLFALTGTSLRLVASGASSPPYWKNWKESCNGFRTAMRDAQSCCVKNDPALLQCLAQASNHFGALGFLPLQVLPLGRQWEYLRFASSDFRSRPMFLMLTDSRGTIGGRMFIGVWLSIGGGMVAGTVTLVRLLEWVLWAEQILQA